MNTVQKNMKITMKVYLQLNTERTKNVFVSHEKNVGQTHHVKTENKNSLRMKHSSNNWERQ